MHIPSIDCDATRSDHAIAREIDQALREIGFMQLRNLGVTQTAIDSMFASAQEFFSGPEAAKTRCAYGAAAENFGYQSIGQESLDPSKPADLKETFTMRDLGGGKIADDRWPSVPFRVAVQGFYKELMQAAQRLQRLLALALEIDAEFFVDCHNGENVTLRLLHYPPMGSSSVDAQQMGAGAHTDYGLLTLLFQDGVGGLQVKSENGVWHDVPPLTDSIVINSGDLLEVWSNGRYRSTWHRVLPQNANCDRYSIALFLDPDSATRVEALPSCVGPDRPARFATTTAGEHLQAKIEATHSAA
ncbi:MAG: 2OG-Fe(II) oxygenase family protein [Pseudomonadota bacterium]